jgi:hypothetical protein
MTFIDVISAMVILVVFLAGISPTLLPTWAAWEKAEAEHRAAQTLRFISETFKSECAKPDRNIEKWRKMIGAARELESIEITEMREGAELRALKASCVIGGEYIEIIGLCTP